MKNLKVKPINKRTGNLPNGTKDHTLVMLAADKGRVRHATLYLNHPTIINDAPFGHTHYIVLPRFLR